MCVWGCVVVCVCVCEITEQRLKAEHIVTSLIKGESLHCSCCRHHHRQTSLITLSKCRFVQAISPLLFAYANMTDLIISFYISHTLIVIVKNCRMEPRANALGPLAVFPPALSSCLSPSIHHQLSTLIKLHVLWDSVAPNRVMVLNVTVV